MCSTIETELGRFAYLPKWFEKLTYLESIAIQENWAFQKPVPGRKNQNNPFLENYIFHTFRRLAQERNASATEQEKNQKIYISKDHKACFNTGLFTKNYQDIYAYFVPNKNPASQQWMFMSFFDESCPNFQDIPILPKRAKYFEDITDLIYNTNLDLRVNSSHILNNPVNRERIPEDLRNQPNFTILFEGAIKLAMKKIQANYKVAVPQYYQETFQFLIPICLRNVDSVDLILAVSKQEGFYTGHTCLTMDMAYNNARLIAKPESEWLTL